MNANPDFDSAAQAYRQFRPTYPEALYAWLLAQVPGRRLAWDVGTGSGQVAQALAEDFAEVLATDTSAEQLAHAPALPNVAYDQAPAERSGLPEDSVDLVTVGQAAHWFDLPKFYHEVQRVIRPGGLLAVWGYHLPRLSPELDANLDYFDVPFLGPYWSEGRKFINDHYASLYFPYEPLSVPAFAMQMPMTAATLVGYLESWSALQAYRRQTGTDPLPDMRRRIEAAWPADRPELVATFPLFVKAARLH